MLNALLSFVIAADFFGFGQMSGDVVFGLKIVLLVMLYGYMHMNLGGGVLSTAVFLIFGYYFLFYANGIFAIIILALFFLMMHGFDMIWGGDIVKMNVQGIMAERQAQQQMMMEHQYRHMMPPP